MATSTSRRKRPRGSVEELPSGALRVSVYAGIDAVNGRRHYLREIVPAGPRAAAEAEKVARRLAAQVDERRNPRTAATVDQLLDKYLETLDVGVTTHRMYTKYLKKHVRPFIGSLKAGALDADSLDSLSMPSFGVVRSIARSAVSSTTGRSGPMPATSAAGHTSAGRFRRRRSGRSISCCTGPSPRHIAGDG